jgi:hypothetical protein
MSAKSHALERSGADEEAKMAELPNGGAAEQERKRDLLMANVAASKYTAPPFDPCVEQKKKRQFPMIAERVGEIKATAPPFDSDVQPSNVRSTNEVRPDLVDEWREQAEK